MQGPKYTTTTTTLTTAEPKIVAASTTTAAAPRYTNHMTISFAAPPTKLT